MIDSRVQRVAVGPLTGAPASARTARPGARVAGAVLCTVGLALLCLRSQLAAAVGLEAVAMAFWVWARAAEDAEAQAPRWAWLRRPAAALWLAVAIHAVWPWLSHGRGPVRDGMLAPLRWLEAGAVVWAGLELLAGLPLARPYSDLPGPLLAMRPWLPVMLPAAGFMVLWRQSPHWLGISPVRHTATVLLLVTAVLGALRAFARRQWIASLRWLAISDSALAGVLVATGVVPERSSLLLWLGACGGHALLLMGELRAASPRPGPFITRLWRAASWTTLAALSWPMMIALISGKRGVAWAVSFAIGALPVCLNAWVTVGRMVAAPERRKMVRAGAALKLTRLAPLAVLATGPVALLVAWWGGFEPPWRDSAAALAPAVLGGMAALVARQTQARPVWRALRGMGRGMPAFAGAAFQAVIGIERRLVALVDGLVRAVASPLHDLHTGDAQEYLLFVVGLGVLALVLPLLQ